MGVNGSVGFFSWTSGGIRAKSYGLKAVLMSGFFAHPPEKVHFRSRACWGCASYNRHYRKLNIPLSTKKRP